MNKQQIKDNLMNSEYMKKAIEEMTNDPEIMKAINFFLRKGYTPEQVKNLWIKNEQ